MRIGAASVGSVVGSGFSRIFLLLAAATFTVAGCARGELFRQYEYEEEIYLSLDGSATVYVNTSIAALDALRGAPFDTSPNARVDRNEVRAWFTSPAARVVRTPSLSRRSNRRFVHVRLDVDDIGRLSTAPPFAWSSYRFVQDGDLFEYRQTLGPAVGKDVGEVGWKGQERVGFRLHMPSEIVYHNAGSENKKRGNILVWEQTLTERLRGEPLTLEARIESRSILSRTLLLFFTTFVAVLVMFVLIIWGVLRRGIRRT